MASKKRTRGRPKDGSGSNKSDFIRRHPNLSARDVVAKAKESGISISPVLVYKVRSRTKPGAAAKTRRAWKSSKSGTASDFVRSMPVTMSAKDVIAAAKAKGIRMSANLVYMVRATDRRRSGAVPKGTGPRGRAGSVAPRRNGAAMVEFKKMAFALGIDNARRALDELERGLATLFGD